MITVGATDAAGQAAFFSSARSQQPPHSGRQSQGPILPRIQQVNPPQRPQPFKTRFDQNISHPNAPQQQNTVIQRMVLAFWCSGWWNETLEMLQAFAALDGRQERRIVLCDTELLPCPIQLINAAQAAFTEVHVYRTPFTMPNGTSHPRTLVGLAGHIAEKLRHIGPILFAMPMIPSQPGSLDRLEYEHAEAMRAGKKILGVIVGQGEERQPFGTFVAHREWLYDPNFPLASGVGMNAESMHAMKYMRVEMLRSFRITPSLLAVPGLAPDRNTLLKAFDLARSPRERPLAGVLSQAPAQIPTGITANDELDALIAAAADTTEPEPAFQEGAIYTGEPQQEEQVAITADNFDTQPALPGDNEIKMRVQTEGMAWIGYEGLSEHFMARTLENPMLMVSVASMHAAFLKRQEAPTKVEVEESSTPAPAKTVKKNVKAKNPPKPPLVPRVL